MYRVDLDKITSKISGTSHDVANVVWGDGARLACPDDLEELFNYCTFKKEILNNTVGVLLTGPNGNTIFIPFGGYHSDSGFCQYNKEGEPVGYIWMGQITFESDILYYTPAIYMGIDDGRLKTGVDLINPWIGLNIRPVKDKDLTED